MRLGDESDHTPRTRRERYRKKQTRFSATYDRFFGTRRRTIVTALVVVLVPIIFVQLFWSTTSLLPNTYVGSVNLSTMDKKEAAEKLNTAYAETQVPVY